MQLLNMTYPSTYVHASDPGCAKRPSQRQVKAFILLHTVDESVSCHLISGPNESPPTPLSLTYAPHDNHQTEKKEEAHS